MIVLGLIVVRVWGTFADVVDLVVVCGDALGV